jgi:hypothetical protein
MGKGDLGQVIQQKVIDVINKHEVEETPGYNLFKKEMTDFGIELIEVKIAWVRLSDENKAVFEKRASEPVKPAKAKVEPKKKSEKPMPKKAEPAKKTVKTD